MKKVQLISIIIGTLILLGLGYSYGYFVGQKSTEGITTETPLANFLKSKVISGIDIVASGEVTEISGRNLTLSKKGDTLTILIGEKATIYRIIPPKELEEPPQPVVREEIEFDEIKINDQVEISCLLKADGSLEGKVVNVLSLP